MFVQIQLNCDDPADMERLQAVAMMGIIDLNEYEIEVVEEDLPQDLVQEKAPLKKRRSRAKSKATEDAPSYEPTLPEEAPPEPEPEEVTEEQLRAEFSKYVNKYGTAKVLALFEEAKVKRLSELKPAQYAPFLLALSNA